MASLPLVSCFCMASLRRLCRSRPAVNRYAARLGADVEADAAPGAAGPAIFGRMVAEAIEAVREADDSGRACLDAEAAALTLFRVHLDRAAVGLGGSSHAASPG